MKRYTSLIVTGHSEKLSGICFVADTDDHDKAMQMLCDAWNKTDPLMYFLAFFFEKSVVDYLLR